MTRRTISLCVPIYNRYDYVIECLGKVYDDSRLTEIVLSDDASADGSYERLQDFFKGYSKIVFRRNLTNLDCYHNKYHSLVFSKNRFAALIDSDNVIHPDYIDCLYEYEWRDDVILTPSYAAPQFDFREYSGLMISKENIAEWIDKPLFETMCNAANYFVNAQMYCSVWDAETKPVTSDSIFMFYRWLSAGYKVYVTPDLEYFHRIHNGSHYLQKNKFTPVGFHQSILKKLRELR